MRPARTGRPRSQRPPTPTCSGSSANCASSRPWPRCIANRPRSRPTRRARASTMFPPGGDHCCCGARIGQGHFGTVYLALGRRPGAPGGAEAASRDGAVRRVSQEGRLLARVRHPTSSPFMASIATTAWSACRCEFGRTASRSRAPWRRAVREIESAGNGADERGRFVPRGRRGARSQGSCTAISRRTTSCATEADASC